MAEAGSNEAAPPQTTENSVGVLGWLGFIIINCAAWGIVSTASYINWVFGFVICFIYTAGLIGLALWLEKKGKDTFRQFINLLWVLACSFILVLGTYIAVQVIGKIGTDEPIVGSASSSSGSSSSLRSISGLVPVGASSTLKAWANGNFGSQNYAMYQGGVYFSGCSKSGGCNLLRSTGVATSPVVPSLSYPSHYAEFGSSLYFTAQGQTDFKTGIWLIDSATPNNATEAISMSSLGSPTPSSVRQLIVEDNALWFKAGYSCSCGWVETIFQSSDGVSAQDQRLNKCFDVCNTNGGGGGGGSGGGSTDSGPNDQTLWAVLFVAIVPMMATAAYVLIMKKLPGPFINLYGGFEVAVIILYLLLVGTENLDDGFATFLKWFITSYNAVLWFLLAAWSLRIPEVLEWQEELKSWAIVFVGVSFFVIIHIDLEIPYRQDAWRWVVYFFVTVLQLLLSTIVSRTVPMVAGAAGLFVLSWKIAIEIAQLAGLGSGEFYMLTVLVIVAFQGAGIVLGAIWYSSQREKVDAMVVALLKCDRNKVSELQELDYVNPKNLGFDV